MQRPGRGGRSSPQTSFLSTNTTASEEADEETARAEHNSIMEELRSRVERAETASEEYQRQLNLLQARLEESQHEQGQLEDRLHQSHGKIEEFESEQSQEKRRQREQEELWKSERTALLQEREEQKTIEDGLHASNQRLKEALAQRESRQGLDGSKSPPRDNTEANHFAPSSSLQRSDSADKAKFAQKDRVIESLRLELAEAQIKIMEMDSMGGGQIHELEKKLMDSKIANARLQEDNESFQLLLSEKTLNGDFSKSDAMQPSGLGSLAEELGTEELESAEGKSDDTRRYESEIKSLKDQNKALALYIENIIGRLLQHNEFENILEKTPDLMSGLPRRESTANTDKELPPPPPSKSDTEEAPMGFLQRARSVVAGPAKRPRPKSQMFGPPLTSTPNEDLSKAPSVPLARSASTRSGAAHKRSQSDMPHPPSALTSLPSRGPPSTGSTAGPMLSPGISPGVTTATRNSFFPPAAAAISPNATPRQPSSSFAPANSTTTTAPRTSLSADRDRDRTNPNPGSSSNSTFSDHSGSVDSPPRGNRGDHHQNNYTGAVMAQNRLRPLRLVQENPVKEEDAQAVAARKKANRGSWMPAWMGQGAAAVAGVGRLGGAENAPPGGL